MTTVYRGIKERKGDGVCARACQTTCTCGDAGTGNRTYAYSLAAVLASRSSMLTLAVVVRQRPLVMIPISRVRLVVVCVELHV